VVEHLPRKREALSSNSIITCTQNLNASAGGLEAPVSGGGFLFSYRKYNHFLFSFSASEVQMAGHSSGVLNQVKDL
jgi:hypothetical protein